MQDDDSRIRVALFWARVGQMNDDARKTSVIARLYALGHETVNAALA